MIFRKQAALSVKVYQVYLQGYCASKMYHNDYSSLVRPWQRVIDDLYKSHHIFTFCTPAGAWFISLYPRDYKTLQPSQNSWFTFFEMIAEAL